MVENKTLILAKYPTNYPIPGEDLIIKSSTFDINAPPPEGGLILKTHYISYDPYQVSSTQNTFQNTISNQN
jgi:NADPH-dependent curcumin reductase CurA